MPLSRLCLTGKMPKNPDAELDPERWLPRKERSYYRGKRRDKRKDIGKNIQTGSGNSGFHKNLYQT